ncbi:DUF4382 domain-containing protein [Ginsengibacter hankyongi]|uniref:DUF4382 domain-containing protein n=1 Tax=Ginsengibacter hankyongi TaxID=2607284 RepID=A0A5J5IGT4_9BACT|nr:DUF4382 domain-containing protein [Ginsengibacter hankyongi]KAA9038591.1 DUF4382 domain-containing protein [Ginsengibacter hankyongi]
MKVNSQKVSLSLIMCLLCSILIFSCSKRDANNTGKSKVQIRLTDSPDPDVREVWVDVKDVLINMGDSNWTSVADAHTGEYNLLDLTNGKDTILADAEIPAGKISQIRLLLGDNNYIITNSGDKISLTTPSAQQSGLKVQINQDVTGGQLYRLILDFDAGKSIVKAGNSGKYILKPVIRVISFVPSGGNLKGVVLPDSVRTAIYAINGMDTVASTYTDTLNGNFFFNDIPSGSYSLSYLPEDTSFKATQQNVSVVLGQTAVADTVILKK